MLVSGGYYSDEIAYLPLPGLEGTFGGSVPEKKYVIEVDNEWHGLPIGFSLSCFSVALRRVCKLVAKKIGY